MTAAKKNKTEVEAVPQDVAPAEDPKHTVAPVELPTFDEAAARERLIERGTADRPKGQGKVFGLDYKKWRPYIIPLRDPERKLKETYAVSGIREMLRGLEYQLAPGLKVIGIADAEVWITPRSLWKFRQREKLRALAENKTWMQLQKSRSRKGFGFVPTAEDLAEPPTQNDE